MHKIAIYDMDKTITRRPTVAPFLMHAFWRVAPWRIILLPVIGFCTLAYLCHFITRARLKEFSVALMIGGNMPLHIVHKLAEETLQGNILPAALAQMATDRAAGYRLVMATASLYFYSNEIGKIVGIPDVVATMNKVRNDGTISPWIDGENCYATAKLAKVQAWLAAQGINRADALIRVYTDHVSDVPCLEFADEPFATNAHAPLRALAKERGWPLLDWH